MFPCLHLAHWNPRFNSHFRLGKVGFDAFQQEVVAQGFGIDGDELSGAKSATGTTMNDPDCSVCNSQQLTQRRLPFEFMDGLSYTTIIELAESLARRRGSALDR